MANERAHVTESQRDRLEYLERMSLELSRMADGGGYKFLSYLLEMAREEAESLRAGSEPVVRATPMVGLRAPRQRSS